MRPIEDVSGQIFQAAVPILSGLHANDDGTPNGRSSADLRRNTAAAQTISRKKRKRKFSPEALENLRAAAAKARAVRAAKRKVGDATCAIADHASPDAITTSVQVSNKSIAQSTSNAAAEVQPRKRRRRRYRRITAEARMKALQEYEAQKKLATEEVKA